MARRCQDAAAAEAATTTTSSGVATAATANKFAADAQTVLTLKKQPGNSLNDFDIAYTNVSSKF